MNPTYGLSSSFAREFARLSREQRRAFRAAVEKLIDALGERREPPRSLRIKRVQGTKDVWEMSYSGDGRATFPSRRVVVQRSYAGDSPLVQIPSG